MILTNNKYIVAMSGGVDSSVAVAILIEQGLEASGMIMHLWGDEIDHSSVPTIDSIDQAQNNAHRLGIDLEILDVRDAFKKYVIDEFLSSYLNGLTPNPCVLCNKYIKFGVFLEQFDKFQGKHLVTGHYAKIVKLPKGDCQLHRAMDKSKDQSYFLCMLDQTQLEKSYFPLGEICKEEVWNKAKHFGIEIKEGKESQDLCFLKNQDYREFLVAHVKHQIKPGEIIDQDEKVLGSHNGLAYYTIGQRKGLGVSSARPMFVLEKDITNNRLVIGFEEELGKSNLTVQDFNWISGTPSEQRFRAQVKIRSTAKIEWAYIDRKTDTDLLVEFDWPIRDITPGQYAVLYDGEIVLGGGEIRK